MDSTATLNSPSPSPSPAQKAKAPRLSLKALSGRGVLAIADQGLISGSNFIISIVLARSLTPRDYGVYALGFEVFLFLSVLYGCLVLEPMSVFGASVYREHAESYLGSMVRIHAVASLAMLGGIAACAWVAYVIAPSSSLPATLAGVSVAGPVVLLFWAARRAFYMKLTSQGAVAGSSIYFAVLIGGLFAFYKWNLLSPFTAFLLMALGAAIAAASMLWRLKPQLSADHVGPHVREVVGQHWDYGKWVLASAIPSWFSGAMYYPLLSHYSGLAEAGKLKALMNLTSPVAQVFVAVSLLSLPYASHVYHEDGPRSANRLVWRLTGLYAGGTALYWAALLVVRGPVVHHLYGGKYAVITNLLPWIAVGSIFRISASAQTNILRGMRLPKLVCAVYATAGVIGIVLGVPAIWRYGIKGAMFTFVIVGAAASIAATVTALRRAAKQRAEAAAAKDEIVPSEEASVIAEG